VNGELAPKGFEVPVFVIENAKDDLALYAKSGPVAVTVMLGAPNSRSRVSLNFVARSWFPHQGIKPLFAGLSKDAAQLS
jgi:hypothetical protein